MIFVPRTVGIAASQQNTGGWPLLFFELEGLLQPKLQRASTMGRRPIRYIVDDLSHTSNCFRIIEARNEQLALCLHDLLLTDRMR